MIILESVKSAHTCVSDVLSSISEYANDSFKENSCEERETFVQMLVAVLQSWKTYEGGDGKIVKLFPAYLMNPADRETFRVTLETFVVYCIAIDM